MSYQELPVDVDISGGISMGKSVADFYNYGKKPANMKVALVCERGILLICSWRGLKNWHLQLRRQEPEIHSPKR